MRLVDGMVNVVSMNSTDIGGIQWEDSVSDNMHVLIQKDDILLTF